MSKYQLKPGASAQVHALGFHGIRSRPQLATLKLALAVAPPDVRQTYPEPDVLCEQA